MAPRKDECGMWEQAVEAPRRASCLYPVLLVSEAPEYILPTLTSRMQRFNLPPLSEEDIAGLLRTRYMLQPEDAADIAHLSAGSVLRAIENIHLGEENRLFFTLFTSLMRLAYARRLKEMKAWSEQVAALGRERQKIYWHTASA